MSSTSIAYGDPFTNHCRASSGSRQAFITKVRVGPGPYTLPKA